MLNRKDFETKNEYRRYTKTSDFLLNYNWKNKSEQTIIHDMDLQPYEQIASFCIPSIFIFSFKIFSVQHIYHILSV